MRDSVKGPATSEGPGGRRDRVNEHGRALADGVKLAGCTVHFVREAMDTGPVVGQAAVPVLSADTAESLAARVLAAEHRLYPRALALVASGRATVERRADGTEFVQVEGEAEAGEALVWP